jgi:DNA-binding NarL/FixJ family response regulator
MVLLSQVRQASLNFPISTSWLRSSGIGTRVGIVSGRPLLLAAIDHLFGWSKSDVVFMDTSPTSALEHIHQYQPGILVVTTDLGQGESGIVLLEQAHQIARELCSVLIVDCSQHDLSLAFRSKAKAVISEQEIFAPGDCLAQMIRALALGNAYRSPQLKAFMFAQKQANGNHLDAVMAPPWLTRREADVAALLLEGHNDRHIAAGLGIAYETVRAHGRSLRHKFGVSHRSQLVLRLLEHGKDRLQHRFPGGVNPPPR